MVSGIGLITARGPPLNDFMHSEASEFKTDSSYYKEGHYCRRDSLIWHEAIDTAERNNYLYRHISSTKWWYHYLWWWLMLFERDGEGSDSGIQFLPCFFFFLSFLCDYTHSTASCLTNLPGFPQTFQWSGTPLIECMLGYCSVQEKG